jgi:hypothetical protein
MQPLQSAQSGRMHWLLLLLALLSLTSFTAASSKWKPQGAETRAGAGPQRSQTLNAREQKLEDTLLTRNLSCVSSTDIFLQMHMFLQQHDYPP